MGALRERWDEKKEKLGCVRRAEGQGGIRLVEEEEVGAWCFGDVKDGFLLHAAGHAGTCWTTSIAVDAYLQASIAVDLYVRVTVAYACTRGGHSGSEARR